MKEASGPKPCLLIVDDDGAIKTLLGATLDDYYDVVCLPDAKDVVAQIDKTAPRMLILDASTPGNDGLQICDEVRSHERNKELPILFMPESNADIGTLGRPFKLPQLRRCIEYLLNQKMK